MAKSQIEEIRELASVIKRLYNCRAFHIEEISIIEKFGQATVWQGIVHVFKIKDHPQTDTCYAWASPIEGLTKRRYYAVLKIPPIDSPEKAVRASIVGDSKKSN